MTPTILIILVALGAAGLAFTALTFVFEKRREQRLRQVVGGDGATRGQMLEKLKASRKDERRRQLEENLKQMHARQKKKQRISLRHRLQRAGLQASERQFQVFSLLLGLALGFLVFVFASVSTGLRLGLMLAGGAFVVGAFGLPNWLLAFLTRRRQEKFLHDLADAIDIMVRGLRSGLPVNDAMRVIAEELPDPVGAEFTEVVEGQKVGITLDQGLERLHERMPLPEVNFLAIVMAIQRETGGNLAEALSNLSRVLRDRKKMKQKIKAVSQEAKASAAIIGALPFVIIGGMAILNPGYLDPLWHTRIGNILVVVSAVWMTMGVLVMRKMINFKI